MLTTRTGGLLLHLTSLPSRFGIGDMGPCAYRFVDFLAAARQHVWQILPLNPTLANRDHSPYTTGSAFALNPLLLSPELLRRRGWLDDADLRAGELAPDGPVHYEAVAERKQALIATAFRKFRAAPVPQDYPAFLNTHANWLDGFALFAALRRLSPRREWWHWPAGLRDQVERDTTAMSHELAEQIEEIRFTQYCCFTQWMELKTYATRHGVQIMGDLPFYVGRDCADVWDAPELFKLNRRKEPTVVAGVPPDRFSATGQLWGNPVYDWEVMRKQGYRWWLARLRHNLTLFDIIRIDHFRGFAAYWEVPADHDTATHGHWAPAPGRDFFEHVFRNMPFAPIVAEDLGTITPDVHELMRAFSLPGMAVLQFAFDTDTADNAYAPHRHTPNCVLYPGTHDNNTTRGWYRHETDRTCRKRLARYLGRRMRADTVSPELLRLGMMSVCRLFITPMQDVLNLGADSRMNDPATPTGNWRWRCASGVDTPALAERLAEWTALYGRD